MLDEVQRQSEAIRPPQPEYSRRAPNEEDKYESKLKVPNSVLDECEQAYTAADGSRIKGSKKHFADTGLMACVCRHDRVLYIANITTPGERQFYVLAIIKQLFKELPPWFVIGFLYDVGCQLDRSLAKVRLCNIGVLRETDPILLIQYPLLPDEFPRLKIGISVFHAYGHQWTCQLIYHPYKQVIFGLSDGEGNERLWWAISLDNKTCRISGVSFIVYESNDHD